MGRYVGNKWVESLPSAGPSDQVQGNSVPVPSTPSRSSSSAPAQTAPAVNPGSTGATYYQTKNGTQTLASMEAQLRAAGWNGGEDVATAYARTTGSPVQVGGVTPGQAPPPSPGAPVVPPTVPGLGGLTPAEQAQVDAFKAGSGFSLQQLAEQKRQFDLNLEWTKQMWANQGLPQLQIQQQAAQLARDQFNTQTELARGNLALAQKAQAAQESQFGATMGLDYMKTAASMGGPADVFQADDFTRGAAASGQTPAFLKALQTNTGLAGFGATSGAAPQALTPGVIANRLTTGATGGQNDAALTAIGGIAQAGGGALSPQALEQLNPDEMAAMGSGFKKLGYSLPAFLQTYQQSRIGQGAAQAA